MATHKLDTKHKYLDLTPIGTGFAHPRVTAVITIVLVGGDLYLSQIGHAYSIPRWGISGIGALILIRSGGAPSCGLRLTPIGGWKSWGRFAGVFALCVMFLALVVYGGLRLFGIHLIPPTLAPEHFGRMLWIGCIQAPLLEETTYRLILCAGMVGAVGARATVAASGIVFCALHIAYGGLGVDNAIAGFFLGWAYLRSGTILVPLTFHVAGNFLVFCGQLTLWRILYG